MITKIIDIVNARLGLVTYRKPAIGAAIVALSLPRTFSTAAVFPLSSLGVKSPIRALSIGHVNGETIEVNIKYSSTPSKLFKYINRKMPVAFISNEADIILFLSFILSIKLKLISIASMDTSVLIEFANPQSTLLIFKISVA